MERREATRTVWMAVRGQYNFYTVQGILIPFRDGVSLFHHKRKWWLAYSDANDHNTGHFKTKKRAIEWYEKGGR